MRMESCKSKMELATCFGILVDVLQEAFKNTISEDQYMQVIRYINLYTSVREGLCITDKVSMVDAQNCQLLARQWPPDYDPADHLCNLRYALTFGEPSIVIEGYLNPLQSQLEGLS